ncbi:hypothetical protein E3N88_11902 [Mikania micrantha]|uniref:Uncharacterized protein n=1 Tax=Mikania micrantha TaxID=192012 RepID=A0A5N6P5Z8_9ASTR|nr:hypothetical protein E3N88_11902 [Mikania micrantha]
MSSSSRASKGSHEKPFSRASGGYEAGPGGQILPHPNLRVFSFAELKTATGTCNSSNRVLGNLRDVKMRVE